MAAPRCILSDLPEVQELAKRIKLSDTETATLIAIWQEDNNINDMDVSPTVAQLKDTMTKLNEQEYSLPIQVEHFKALKKALGKKACEELGLNDIVILRKNGRQEAKKAGYIMASDANQLQLQIAAYLDMKGLANKAALKEISWLSPARRKQIYDRYAESPYDKPTDYLATLARLGLNAYNKAALEAKNKATGSNLIVETREHQRLRELRKHFTPTEYRDRVREVANLFSRMFDTLIDNAYKAKKQVLSEYGKDTKAELKEFTPAPIRGEQFAAPREGLEMEERRRTQHALINEMSALRDPERRKTFALKEVGGPNGILEFTQKRLETIRKQRSDEKFVAKLEKVFGVEMRESLIDNKTGKLDHDKMVELRTQFSRVVDNLQYLMQDAAPLIAEKEGIQILLKADMSTVSDEDFNPNDEDQVKETWMYKYDSVDRFLEAKENVKRLVRELPIRDDNGNETKTLFGAVKYYQPEEIIGVLHENFIGVHDSPAMIAKLEEIAPNYPWAQDIVDSLREDDWNEGDLTTNFFRTFRLAQKEFGGLRLVDGVLQYQPYGYEQQKQEIRGLFINNIKSRTALNNSPVYDQHGNLVLSSINLKRNALKDLITELDKIHWKTTTPKLIAAHLESNPKYTETIIEALKSLGMPASRDAFFEALKSNPKKKGYHNNLSLMLNRLDKIYDTLYEKASSAKAKSTFYTIDKSVYRTISNGLEDVAPLFVDKAQLISRMEPYVYDVNGERRMTHVLATQLDNLFEGLNGKLYRNAVEGNKAVQDKYEHTQATYRNETPQQYLERKFGRDRFYRVTTRSGKPVWLNRWMHDIERGVIKPGDMRYVEVLDAYGKPFEKWTLQDRTQIAYDLYKQGYYMLPVTSDTQAARFFTAPKYTHDEIVKSLSAVMRQEYERSVKKTYFDNKTYNANKSLFCFMPELNAIEFSVNGKSYGKGMAGYTKLLNEASDTDIDAAVRSAIEDVLRQYRDKFAASQVKDNTIKNAEDEDDALGQYNENIRDFVENNTLAQILIIQMTAGDLAFYGDYKQEKIDEGITTWEGYTDFQKRYKQVIVPLKELDTHAPGGKQTQRTLVINDPVIKSLVYEQTEKFLRQQWKARKITKAHYDAALKGAKEIMVTNGQAFRSLDSHIALMHMLGTWTKEKQASIDRIRRNEAQPGDMDTYLEVQKLFSTGLIEYKSGDEYTVSPFQHKCSEQVLFPEGMSSSLTAKAPILAALERIMQTYHVDTIHFSSTVKVGNNGAISLPENYNKMTADELYKAIGESIDSARKGSDTQPAYDPIQEIPMEDVGTVSYVPEHGIDRENAVGTQTQKIIPADLPLGSTFKLPNGKKVPYSREEVIQKYNAVWTEKIKRAYRELTGEVITTERLSRMLQDAAEASKQSNSLLDRAFELDAYGNFIVPLCNLSRMKLSSSVLNAVIRKAVGRVYTNGGQFVLATALGLEEDLKVKYREDEDGTMHLEYIECMMPVTSMRLVNQYIKKNKDGEMLLDLNDIPEELREAIGYRIPTQGKHFIAPLKIVGLLPQLSGNTIVVAPDVTYLTDSDYDVDKEFVMLPSFERGKDGKYHKVQYNMDGNVANMFDGALNNMMIDIMRSILTSDDIAGQTINSGDPSAIRDVADEIKELRGMSDIKRSPASIMDVLEQYDQNNDGKEMIAAMAASNSSHAIAQQTSMPRFEGDKARNPLRLRTPISLFGKEGGSLSRQKDLNDKEFISKNLGDGIGAATDNAKSPSLYWLNINRRTVGVATLMLRLGYSLEDVGLFLNIPSIREYSRTNNPDAVREAYGIERWETTGNYRLFGSKEDAKLAIKGEKDTEYLTAALKVFISLSTVSNELFTIDNLTKNDTGSGVPHGDIGANFARIIQYHQFLNKPDRKRLIDGWEGMFIAADTDFENAWNDKDFQQAVKDSRVSIAQAFTSYSFFGGFRIMQRLFPIIGNGRFIALASEILGNRPSPEKAKQFLWAAMQYAQSDFDCWRKDRKSVEESHRWYMEDFPKLGAQLVAKHPELAQNALYRDLQFGHEDIKDYPFIDLRFNTEEGNELYTQAWLELLNHKSEDVRTFAQDLYKYGYHRNGFIPRTQKQQYTSKGNYGRRANFAYLAPIEVLESIPGLLDETGDVRRINSRFSTSADEFAVIYLRNNLSQIYAKPDYAEYPDNYNDEDIEHADKTIDVSRMPAKEPRYKWYLNANGNYRKSFAIILKDGDIAYYILNEQKNTYMLVDSLGWEGRATEYRRMQDVFNDPGFYAQYNIEDVEADIRAIRQSSDFESEDLGDEEEDSNGNEEKDESKKVDDTIPDATGQPLCGEDLEF